MNKRILRGGAARCSWAAFSVAAALAVPTAAQTLPGAPGSDLASVLTALEANHPELRALGAEVDAARDRYRAAGAWPDPMLQMELRDIPLRDPTLSPARAGDTRYAVRQTIPLGGKLAYRRDAAEAEIVMAGARRASTAIELRARARTAWSQYWYAVRAERITASVLQLLGNLEEVARSRYGTGLVPQADAIRAQTELTSIRSDLLGLDSQRRQATARLNALIGRAPDAPLAEPGTPPPLATKVADFAALSQRLADRNPELVMRGAQIAAAERTSRVVRANRWPDLTVGLATIQMRNRLVDYEVMVEVNIPWQRDVLRAAESEAAANERAAHGRREAALWQLQGELADNWAALTALDRRIELLQATLLPQAQLTFDSALSGYQNGRVDFGALLDAERQIRRARLDILMLELERQMRVADIERLVGEDL